MTQSAPVDCLLSHVSQESTIRCPQIRFTAKQQLNPYILVLTASLGINNLHNMFKIVINVIMQYSIKIHIVFKAYNVIQYKLTIKENNVHCVNVGKNASINDTWTPLPFYDSSVRISHHFVPSRQEVNFFDTLTRPLLRPNSALSMQEA